MPGLTGVFQFPFPVRGDAARLIPSQIQTLAEKVDAALAKRAVAPDLETAAALATRTTALESRATALEASAWTPLGLAAPWTSYGAPSSYPAIGYRTEGKRVYLRGWLNNSSAATPALSAIHSAALPVALRPVGAAATAWAGSEKADGSGVPWRIEISVSGFVQVYRAQAINSFLNLEPVSWPIP